MKKNVTFQLEQIDIDRLKELAALENRSIASFLRNIVLKIIADSDVNK